MEIHFATPLGALTRCTKGLHLACGQLSALMGENFFMARDELVQQLVVGQLRRDGVRLRPPDTAVPFAWLCIYQDLLGFRWESLGHFVTACGACKQLRDLRQETRIITSCRFHVKDLLAPPEIAAAVAVLVHYSPKISAYLAGRYRDCMGGAGEPLRVDAAPRPHVHAERLRDFVQWRGRMDCHSRRGVRLESGDLRRAAVPRRPRRDLRVEMKLALCHHDARIPLKLTGYVDGYDATGRIVESKNRLRHKPIPKAEHIQMEAYMWLRGSAICYHIENVKESSSITACNSNENLRDEILAALVKLVEELAAVAASGVYHLKPAAVGPNR